MEFSIKKGKETVEIMLDNHPGMDLIGRDFILKMDEGHIIFILDLSSNRKGKTFQKIDVSDLERDINTISYVRISDQYICDQLTSWYEPSNANSWSIELVLDQQTKFSFPVIVEIQNHCCQFKTKEQTLDA